MHLNEEQILKRTADLYMDQKYAEHLAQTDSPNLLQWRRTREDFEKHDGGKMSRQVKALAKAICEAINNQQP